MSDQRIKLPKLPETGFIGRNSDLFLAAGMLGVLFVLLVPLPSFILDFAITINLSCALMILIITLTVREPLEFSTFPSLLLFTTLYRLALNVASTRLILLNGDAGDVIRAFGDFVVGGELLVGLVIFLILVVIQFIVITKGSNRISEVAARFTLDGMPGKQMAIDADLNAGMITEEQARERRDAITSEAEFYGAMDGAGKFVRGDSIAGLIITLVNIIGGVAVGMTKDLAVTDALQKYAVLTVGDGLVSQIPALIIAIASGVLVTKSRSNVPLAREVAGQFLLSPKAMRIAGFMVLSFAIMPGLPAMPFAILGILIIGLSRIGGRLVSALTAPRPEEDLADPETAAELTPEALTELLRIDRMGIEIGYRLIPLVDESRSGNLLDHIAMVRKQFAQQYGLVVPPIRMRDNLTLQPNRYRILLGGQEVATGELYPEHVLAMDPSGGLDEIPGVKTEDPTFGLPATWVSDKHKSEAEMLGYTVVDPESVMVTHLTEIVKEHADELLSREDVQKALDRVKETNPTVVNELVPDVLGIGVVQRVLKNLLRDRIPIRNMVAILETLSDAGAEQKDPDQLTELVRARLSRTIAEICSAPSGKIEALTLAPTLEQEALQTLVAPTDGNPQNGAALLHRMQEAICSSWQRAQSNGHEPVLLVRAPLRRHLSELLRALKPPIPVLAYGEVLKAQGVDAVGLVELETPQPETTEHATVG
ncbi:MAG: flagellar biosynthesis protein FlhA [Planctomycetes bacterium]|nr:flagellar biosynthesis protein FlhA [Planctomycetota bacterium]